MDDSWENKSLLVRVVVPCGQLGVDCASEVVLFVAGLGSEFWVVVVLVVGLLVGPLLQLSVWALGVLQPMGFLGISWERRRPSWYCPVWAELVSVAVLVLRGHRWLLGACRPRRVSSILRCVSVSPHRGLSAWVWGSV